MEEVLEGLKLGSTVRRRPEEDGPSAAMAKVCFDRLFNLRKERRHKNPTWKRSTFSLMGIIMAHQGHSESYPSHFLLGMKHGNSLFADKNDDNLRQALKVNWVTLTDVERRMFKNTELFQGNGCLKRQDRCKHKLTVMTIIKGVPTMLPFHQI